MNATTKSTDGGVLDRATSEREVYDMITDLDAGDRVVWGDRSQACTVARVVTPDDAVGQAITASVIKHDPTEGGAVESDLRAGDVFLSPNGHGLTGKTFALIHGPRGGFYALARCESRGRSRPALFRAVRSYHTTRHGQPGQGAFKFETWFDDEVRVVGHGDEPDALDPDGDLPSFEELGGHRVVAYDGDDMEHFEVGEAHEVLEQGLVEAHEQAREEREREADDAVGTVEVVDTFDHDEYGLKAVLIAPPPWETPDGAPGANEAIKAVGWNETHHTFDDEREAWIVDLDALAAVADSLADSGYEVVDRIDDEDAVAEADESDADEQDDGEDHRRFLDRFARSNDLGDRVEVRYEPKQGDGVSTKAGRITALHTSDGHVRHEANVDDRHVPDDQDPKVTFERDDGHRMYVTLGKYGDLSLFTTKSSYPYVGDVVAVQAVDEGDLDEVDA